MSTNNMMRHIEGTEYDIVLINNNSGEGFCCFSINIYGEYIIELLYDYKNDIVWDEYHFYHQGEGTVDDTFIGMDNEGYEVRGTNKYCPNNPLFTINMDVIKPILEEIRAELLLD